MRQKVAISIGDLNGIGIQLALENHSIIKQTVDPFYCIDRTMLNQAAQKLNFTIPADFQSIENVASYFKITPGHISKESGTYAYSSFVKAVDMAKKHEVDALCTLPIHKKAWELAGIRYKGHTDALRDFFKVDAIMMLGCPKMYVALFTEHIPLEEVPGRINEPDLTRFLVDFYHTAKPTSTVAVLGLNPHAGDNGVLGNEELHIQAAINKANLLIDPSFCRDQGRPTFSDPIVPDIAFTPQIRKHYTHYVAMYHDQGLAPLKALHFEEGINISLNLPVLRTSVDHGTAFDIAYTGVNLNHQSYLNAIDYIAQKET